MICFTLLSVTFVAITVIVYFLYRYITELFELKNLKGKSVLVTGCDHGFGYWLALKLAQNQLKVYAGCLTEKGKTNLLNKSEENRSFSQFLEPFLLDVTDENSVNKALELVEASQEKNQLWAIVNNAGIAGTGMPDDFLTESDYKTILDVNFYGTWRMCHAFKPLLKKSKGRIVNCASLAGRMISPGLAPYCVSKHMVEVFSDILRYELEHFQVSVHILEPGAFKTPIVQPILNDEIQKYFDEATPALKEEYGQTYMDEWKRRLKGIFDKRADPDYMKVVDAYYHAITALYPRQRYRVGKSAHIMTPVTCLPIWMQDIIMGFLRKKSPAFIPQACLK